MKFINLFPRSLQCLSIACMVFIAGCMPKPPADDNSHTTFIKEALPKLLGRKAINANEVKVLADISSLLSRKQALRAIMQQPRYVDYWTDVIVDQLKVQREGIYQQPLNCFGEPMRVDANGEPISDGGALAQFIRDNDVTSQVPNAQNLPFNMVDIIRSSIELDDLSPIYRAYLFALNSSNGLPGGQAQQRQRTDILGLPFNEVFLNRKVECLACHNSEFSTTGGPDWDRAHPIPVANDAALYGTAFGNLDQNYGFLRGTGGGFPWGMTACGPIRSNVSNNFPTTFAGLSSSAVTLAQVDGQFKAGYQSTKLSGLARTANLQSSAPPNIPGDQAYAFTVASSIVNSVWREIMGEQLTIANYYARNSDQMSAQWNLTEFKFIPSSWSLQELLVEIMSTRFYNRKTPQDTNGCAKPRGVSGATPFCLQMIFDPWVERDPRVPDADLEDPDDPKQYRNGQGDLVHRYSPHNLLRSLEAALGWPAPKRFASATQYPDRELVTAIGQYLSNEKQGSHSVDFQGLLKWEADLGNCQKPAGVATDWIDRLVAQQANFNAANPASPITVADLVATIKDRLIQEQEISPDVPNDLTSGTTETSLLVNLFGTQLSTSTASVSQLGRKVRDYCGVLIKTPAFMLANIKPETPLTQPRLAVCNEGQPCSYRQICNSYVGSLGTFVRCLNNGVSNFIDFDFERYFAKVCPNGDCSFVLAPGVLQCAQQPESCGAIIDELFPLCDPRFCDPSPIDFNQQQVLLINVDGARVQKVDGVSIIKYQSNRATRLKRGQRLAAGDIVTLPAYSQLAVEGEKRFFATPREGMLAPHELLLTENDQRLLAAAEEGDRRVINALIKKGAANINARDKTGRTALMLAVEAGAAGAVELLVGLGADINLKDYRGVRAIELAGYRRDKESQEILAKRGAVIDDAKIKLAANKPMLKQWVLMVADPELKPSEPAKPGKKMTTRQALALSYEGKVKPQYLDIAEVQRERKESGYHSHGQAGRVMNEKEQALALEQYLKSGFAQEHPKSSRGDDKR